CTKLGARGLTCYGLPSAPSRPAAMKPNRPCDSSAMPAVKNRFLELPSFFAPLPTGRAHRRLIVRGFLLWIDARAAEVTGAGVQRVHAPVTPTPVFTLA